MPHGLMSAACLVLAFAAPVQAAGAHAHGEGRLGIAIERDGLVLALELPLDAAVGFERAPRTAAERAALDAARKALEDPALFLPTAAAKCLAAPPRVTLPTFDGQPGERHADIDATYAFRCAAPTALKGIETSLFRQFKRLYRIEAQRVGPAGQGAGRLTPKTPSLAW